MPLARSGESAEPIGRSRGGQFLLGTGLVLALGAAAALVATNDLRYLRLAILAALWAALVGAFLAARYRGRLSDRDEHAADLQSIYELELQREIAARHEYELQVEAEIRSELEQESRKDLAALRQEMHSLRQTLESLLGGEVLVERYALHAQGTRMRQLDGERQLRRPQPKRLTAGTSGGENGYEPVTERIERVVDAVKAPQPKPQPESRTPLPRRGDRAERPAWPADPPRVVNQPRVVEPAPPIMEPPSVPDLPRVVPPRVKETPRPTETPRSAEPRRAADIGWGSEPVRNPGTGWNVEPVRNADTGWNVLPARNADTGRNAEPPRSTEPPWHAEPPREADLGWRPESPRKTETPRMPGARRAAETPRMPEPPRVVEPPRPAEPTGIAEPARDAWQERLFARPPEPHPAEVSDRWFLADSFRSEIAPGSPGSGRHSQPNLTPAPRSTGGRRRRAEPTPPPPEPPRRHARPEPETGGGRRRRAEGTPSRQQEQPSGSHSQGHSVADLLATHGSTSPRRRRRRED